MGDYDANFTTDLTYIDNLSRKSYMGAVSPWFFTVSNCFKTHGVRASTHVALQHYGPDTYNKNWIYRSDDWLFAERWEMLIANRNRVNFAEVVTWNDYGESHYVGPIEGIQPMSQSWVDGFDHQGMARFEVLIDRFTDDIIQAG